MYRTASSLIAVLAPAPVLTCCGASGNSMEPSAIGGDTVVGGAPSTGGMASTGGTKTSGGRTNAGGSPNTGGALETGGTQSTGGWQPRPADAPDDPIKKSIVSVYGR